MHTPEGLEIRCYSDDFAAYIDGLPPGGVCIGVADMAHPTTGSIRSGGDGIRLDLGEPGAASRARMAAGTQDVVEMLSSPAFASLVEPGSITVDHAAGMSSHAWGTVPLGAATGPDGAVAGTVGLRVVDGSVLPGPLRSGPHASVLMTADAIARRIAP
ncbi:GMC oxidoreductase [Tsukamurella sp. PLM1]|uniref:GMC oxidoreductase n=1 Tax=Tsukamurella sp. PLM1 TaxID=2929795 RepID=UPI0020483250|nr:GMC oxidoreductase [Tsukamurella sp. PLM1]BDH55340.1 hypothetical protein MTP03_02790 [Tsukamurella sp. PLM1]